MWSSVAVTVAVGMSECQRDLGTISDVIADDPRRVTLVAYGLP